MRGIGGFLIFAGFASAILHFTDYQLRILMWSESMQPALGIGLGVVGCALVGASVALQKNKNAKAIQQLPPPPGYQFAQPPQQPPAQWGPGPQQQAPYGPPPVRQQPYAPQQPQYPAQPYAPQQPYDQPGSFGPQGFGPQR
jgi:hypothetical protein